jgi:hypothetical protein
MKNFYKWMLAPPSLRGTINLNVKGATPILGPPSDRPMKKAVRNQTIDNYFNKSTPIRKELFSIINEIDHISINLENPSSSTEEWTPDPNFWESSTNASTMATTTIPKTTFADTLIKKPTSKTHIGNKIIENFLKMTFQNRATPSDISSNNQSKPVTIVNKPVNPTQAPDIDLTSLLGPVYTKFSTTNPNVNKDDSTKSNNRLGTKSTHKNTDLPQHRATIPQLEPHEIPSNTQLDHSPTNLADLLGPKYTLACLPKQASSNNRKVTFSDNNARLIISANPTIDDDDNTNDLLSVSFQERLEVLQEALLPWRQARSLLAAQAKAEARAEHLDLLKNAGLLPAWALGLDNIPGYLEPEIDRIIDLKKHHAIEVLQTSRDLLLSRARTHATTGRASLITCEILYKDDKASWAQARDLLAQLVGTDRSKCATSLRNRLDSLRDNPIPTDDIRASLIDGPRLTSRRPIRSTRNRSRSPVKTRASSRPAQNNQNNRNNINKRPNYTRGNENVNPSNAGKSNQLRNNQPKNTYQGREVLTFSRSNFNGRNRSPQSSPDVRSHNSLWNEYDAPRTSKGKGKGKRSQNRNLNLTEAEQALVAAFRNRNDDQ